MLEKQKELLTPEEAAAFLDVSRRTIDRYRENGKLTAYKKQDNWRVFFDKEELEFFKNGVAPETR